MCFTPYGGSMLSIKNLFRLVMLVCLLLVITAALGLFFQGEGTTRFVTALDGHQVELLNRGTYANHSILRATSYMGADLTIMIIVVPLLLVSSYVSKKSSKSLMILCGGLMIAFYYSISLAFGAAFNPYFLLYTVLFAVSGFALANALGLLIKTSRSWIITQTKNVSTVIFLIIAGLSALVWLTLIIPTFFSGDYSAFIDVNTTEPTFALDIGIVFPLFMVIAYALHQKRRIGYVLTPVLLMFYALVGVMVSIQTSVQYVYQVDIPLEDLVRLVISFIVLGMVSLGLIFRFFKRHFKEVAI